MPYYQHGGFTMNKRLDSTINELEKAKLHSKNGIGYWTGRNIYKILGYATWESFEHVINKACMACESSGTPQDNHFRGFTKKSETGRPSKDYFLTRYACYLIAMNGDTNKPEIGTAQTYFAVQTRRQEIQEQLTAAEHRIQLRERVKDANRSLSDAAKNAGVQKYGQFHNAGYRGLYEMDLKDIKRYKGLSDKDNLLDHAGRTELAANEFRITQTEDKLKRDNIDTQRKAIKMHQEVGQEVRATIEKLGGTNPEDLPTEVPIKELESKIKKVRKAITGKH